MANLEVVMELELAQYITEKIVCDLRCRRKLPEPVAAAINKYPLVDTLRLAVDEYDVPMLKSMVMSNSLEVGNLAVSLLRKFDRESSIKEFFLSAWKEAMRSSQTERQLHLMWRLLDMPDLTVSRHQEIYEFVRSNMDEFLEYTTVWSGGPECVLEVCRTRLGDSSFPSTKAWGYLCIVMGSPEKESANKLLQEWRLSGNKFVSKVAGELAALRAR